MEDADRPKAAFIGDVTLADGISVKPNTVLQKIWQVKNTGSKAWPAGTRLQFIGGDVTPAPAGSADANWSDAALVPLAEPGQIISISLDIQTPESLGRFRGTFRLVTPDGIRFGPRIWIDLEVTADGLPSQSSHEQKEQPSTESATDSSGPSASSSQQDPKTAFREAIHNVVNALGRNSSNPLQSIMSAIQSAASSISPSHSADSTGASSPTVPEGHFPYTGELDQVHAMGFTEQDVRVKELLVRYRGNVARTLNQLLSDQ